MSWIFRDYGLVYLRRGTCPRVSAYDHAAWERPIAPPEYPGHFEVRRVSNGGAIRLAMHQRFLSNALANEYVGLEEVDDGIWNIIYYTTLLGRIDERDGVITGL